MTASDGVFCDDLRVTVPESDWADVEADVRSVLDVLGARVDFKAHDRSGWRVEGGTAQVRKFGRVRCLSASGQMLAGLRAAKLLGQFVGALAGRPHRVTGIHCTLDRPEPTPPVLSQLFASATSPDGLGVGRKRVPVQHVDRYLGIDHLGRETGSIYLGSEYAELRAVVYDKRHQIISKGGADLGHDLTRYELRCRNVGATLGDVLSPSRLFWHYMAPDILPAPAGALPWSPGGVGFDLEPAEVRTGLQRIQARVFASDDLGDLLRLAYSVEGGEELLFSLLRARLYAMRPVVTS